MEKNEKDKSVGVLLCYLSSKSTAKWLHLKKNSISLSHTMKENEETCNYGLTTDRDLHHGQSMVSSVSVLFCSFFIPRP